MNKEDRGSYNTGMVNQLESSEANELARLRLLLERLANADDGYRPSEIRQLSFDFRDCRLQVIQECQNELTNEQLHDLQQLDWRLEGVRDRSLVWEHVPGAAKRALASFGWTSSD
jgi:hypothetical protein